MPALLKRPEVVETATFYPGLPRNQIYAIFRSKFVPENLYKLRYGHAFRDDGQRAVKFDDNGQMTLQTSKGSLRDFGDDATIWSEGMLSYIDIMGDLFGKDRQLHRALREFHRHIMDLARTYHWKLAVLPLALGFHSERCSVGPKIAADWVMPHLWINRLCTPDKTMASLNMATRTSSKRPFEALNPPNSSKDVNDMSVLCTNHASAKGCKWDGCMRDHGDGLNGKEEKARRKHQDKKVRKD